MFIIIMCFDILLQIMLHTPQSFCTKWFFRGAPPMGGVPDYFLYGRLFGKRPSDAEMETSLNKKRKEEEQKKVEEAEAASLFGNLDGM